MTMQRVALPVDPWPPMNALKRDLALIAASAATLLVAVGVGVGTIVTRAAMRGRR